MQDVNVGPTPIIYSQVVLLYVLMIAKRLIYSTCQQIKHSASLGLSTNQQSYQMGRICAIWALFRSGCASNFSSRRFFEKSFIRRIFTRKIALSLYYHFYDGTTLNQTSDNRKLDNHCLYKLEKGQNVDSKKLLVVYYFRSIKRLSVTLFLC